MANKLANGSSLEAIINDAERSGASAEKARQIYDLVEANASSEYLRRFEIEFGPDSTEKPAVWIHLIVDPDLRPSRQKIARLSKLVRKVRSVLLREDLGLWPFVDVRGRP